MDARLFFSTGFEFEPVMRRNWNCTGKKGYTLTTTMAARTRATPGSKVGSEYSAALN
jgi:hypothetical protein